MDSIVSGKEQASTQDARGERLAPGHLFRRATLPFLGLGFYQAWLSLSFYTTALFADIDGLTAMVNAIWALGAWGFALAMIAFIVPTRHVLARWSQRRPQAFCIGAASLTALGTLATVLAGSAANIGLGASGSLAIALAGMFVSGVASGCLVLLWGGAFRRLRTDELVALTFGARVVGVAVFVGASFLSDAVKPLFAVALPLLSGAMLLAASRRDDGLPQPAPVAVLQRRRISPQLFIPLVALFLYALGGELFRQICLSHESLSVDTMGMGYTVSIGVTAAVLLLVVVIYGRMEPASGTVLRLIRPATFFMAIAFIAFACLRLPGALSYGIFGVGFYCMTAFAWIIAVDVARRFDVPPLTVIAVSQLPTGLGPCLLPLFQPSVALLAHSSAQSLNMVAMLFSCLMFAVALLMLGERNVETVWGTFPPLSQPRETGEAPAAETGNAPAAEAGEGAVAAPGSAPAAAQEGPPYAERFASLAAGYKLTKRETEVAALLARGRNLPYVEEVLVISHGTAQTHARHIYQKMGVHTRQEFIDLVEHLIDQGK